MTRPSGDSLDLTGQWNGTFSYPEGHGPATPFLANIIQQNGSFSGSIIEPDQFYGQPTLSAAIDGHRSGLSIDFTKTYSASAKGYRTPVDYVGQLSVEGRVITGIWSLLDLDGKFEMHRDMDSSAIIEEELAETISVAR